MNENNMLKDALIKVFGELDNYHYSTWSRLNKCQAYYQDIMYNGVHIEVLKSYSTIVAFCMIECGSVYIRDFYSNTTVQHVSKFTNLMHTKYNKDILKFRVDKMK